MAFGARIQSTSVDSGSVSSASLAYGSNLTAGNILILAVHIGSTSETITSITDTGGNTWVEKKTQVQTTDGHKLHVWVVFNCAAGANTVTLNKSGTGTLRWAIHEFTAAVSSDTTDQTNSGQADASSAVSSGNVTTTVANELLFAAQSDSNSAGFNAGSGYTKWEDVATGRLVTESKVVSITGTYVGDGTKNIADNWAAIIVTISDGGGAAAGDGPTLMGQAAL